MLTLEMDAQSSRTDYLLRYQFFIEKLRVLALSDDPLNRPPKPLLTISSALNG